MAGAQLFKNAVNDQFKMSLPNQPRQSGLEDSGGSDDHMNSRRSADEIINGLPTTADKIRALANANYDRTEISKILGIRYQHVRNVMLRSGLGGGLRRELEAEREPVEVDAAPAAREDTSWKVLTDAGFQFIGEWTQDPKSLLRLDAKAPSAPGVYAFIVDDVVVYVGLTLSGLKTRFDQYRRGHKGQRTSSRINSTDARCSTVLEFLDCTFKLSVLA